MANIAPFDFIGVRWLPAGAGAKATGPAGATFADKGAASLWRRLFAAGSPLSASVVAALTRQGKQLRSTLIGCRGLLGNRP